MVKQWYAHIPSFAHMDNVVSARMCKDMYIYGHVLAYPHVGCAAVEDTEGDLHTGTMTLVTCSCMIDLLLSLRIRIIIR